MLKKNKSNTYGGGGYSLSFKKSPKIAYVMILPALLMLMIFVIIPLFMSLQKSTTNWTFYKPPEFVGFDNYRMILNTTYFRQAVGNAFKFVIITVPLRLIICFLFANILKGVIRSFSNFVRTAIYIPGLMSGVVTAVIFFFILHYKGGIANQLIMIFGGERVAFLRDPFWAMVSIIAPRLWLDLGGGTILMFAALLNVPDEYYEAAAMDGAGAFRKMISITLPSMKNIFLLLTITGTTQTLQMFELPYLITNGGPRNSTLTPMLYLFNNFRDVNSNMGFTVAGAVLMMGVIAIINSFIFKIIKAERSTE